MSTVEADASSTRRVVADPVVRVTRIRPTRGWVALGLRELWRWMSRVAEWSRRRAPRQQTQRPRTRLRSDDLMARCDGSMR